VAWRLERTITPPIPTRRRTILYKIVTLTVKLGTAAEAADGLAESPLA